MSDKEKAKDIAKKILERHSELNREGVDIIMNIFGDAIAQKKNETRRTLASLRAPASLYALAAALEMAANGAEVFFATDALDDAFKFAKNEAKIAELHFDEYFSRQLYFPRTGGSLVFTLEPPPRSFVILENVSDVALERNIINGAKDLASLRNRGEND